MNHARYGVLNLFCGAGGCALGFQRAGFDLVGAVDSWGLACEAYRTLTGHAATQADLGAMTPAELLAACTRRPDVVVMSPPCKGNSRCLSEELAATPHYQRLNALAYRATFLVLSTWQTPPPLLLLENVPGITLRSAAWLEEVIKLLHAHGYAVHASTHDCGELGSLAQHRRRYLLVARHMAQAQAFLHQPPIQRVRGIGEVLAELPIPLPGSTAGGPMHRLPLLSPTNLIRLALIPAGRDWRALPASVLVEEVETQAALKDRAARQNGGYGVGGWDDPSHAVVAHATVSSTWSSVADPRLTCSPRGGGYGVGAWEESAGCVVGAACHDNGSWSVSDPRIDKKRREGSLGVKGWGEASTAVIGAAIPQNHPCTVADPRLEHTPRKGGHRVGAWAEPSGTVIGEARIDKGYSVADPRIGAEGASHAGKYGIEGWEQPAHTVIAQARTGKSWAAISDPRPAAYTHAVDLRGEVPAVRGPRLDLTARGGCTAIIRAADGTWHRPLTTLELAVIQGFPAQLADGSPLVLPGRSHARWRELIGNAIPPAAAEAIAKSCLDTLNAAAVGFRLCGEPIWVSPAEGVAA